MLNMYIEEQALRVDELARVRELHKVTLALHHHEKRVKDAMEVLMTEWGSLMNSQKSYLKLSAGTNDGLIPVEARTVASSVVQPLLERFPELPSIMEREYAIAKEKVQKSMQLVVDSLLSGDSEAASKHLDQVRAGIVSFRTTCRGADGSAKTLQEMNTALAQLLQRLRIHVETEVTAEKINSEGKPTLAALKEALGDNDGHGFALLKSAQLKDQLQEMVNRVKAKDSEILLSPRVQPFVEEACLTVAQVDMRRSMTSILNGQFLPAYKKTRDALRQGNLTMAVKEWEEMRTVLQEGEKSVPGLRQTTYAPWLEARDRVVRLQQRLVKNGVLLEEEAVLWGEEASDQAKEDEKNNYPDTPKEKEGEEHEEEKEAPHGQDDMCSVEIPPISHVTSSQNSARPDSGEGNDLTSPVEPPADTYSEDEVEEEEEEEEEKLLEEAVQEEEEEELHEELQEDVPKSPIAETVPEREPLYQTISPALIDRAVRGALMADAYALSTQGVKDWEILKDLDETFWSSLQNPLAPELRESSLTAGDFTCGGNQAVWLHQYCTSTTEWSLEGWRQQWLRRVTEYDGQLDTASQDTLAILRDNSEAMTGGPTQQGSLAAIGRIASLLLLAPSREHFVQQVQEMVGLAHHDQQVLATAAYFARVLYKVCEGAEVKESVLDTPMEDPDLSEVLMMEGSSMHDLTSKDDETAIIEAIVNQDREGGIAASFSAVLALFLHCRSWQEGVVLSTKAGGDASGRAMVFGMIMAASGGSSNVLPADWLRQTTVDALIPLPQPLPPSQPKRRPSNSNGESLQSPKQSRIVTQ